MPAGKLVLEDADDRVVRPIVAEALYVLDDALHPLVDRQAASYSANSRCMLTGLPSPAGTFGR
jgi:hypothetical protein